MLSGGGVMKKREFHDDEERKLITAYERGERERLLTSDYVNSAVSTN
jgi:hypothetical protein